METGAGINASHIVKSRFKEPGDNAVNDQKLRKNAKRSHPKFQFPFVREKLIDKSSTGGRCKLLPLVGFPFIGEIRHRLGD